MNAVGNEHILWCALALHKEYVRCQLRSYYRIRSQNEGQSLYLHQKAVKMVQLCKKQIEAGCYDGNYGSRGCKGNIVPIDIQ